MKRFVDLALACVHREYPNQLALRMESDADACTPRALTPAFYGCYDWHSAVHAHWVLCRAARQDPDLAAACRDKLRVSFTPDKLRAELAHLCAHPAFERPYGLAWLLQLHAELTQWRDDEADAWAMRLQPLADAAADHLATWLPKLTHPVRSGTHSQTAFSLCLVYDWCLATGREPIRLLVRDRALAFFGSDERYPLHLEPSGEDFLSASLGAGDLMRRVLEPDDFAAWMSRALPTLGEANWLPIVRVSDPSDGRLAHLDGLNLSRAWMLEGMARGLPPADPRRALLDEAGHRHRDAGLAAVLGRPYAGAHWLGTFAVYLTLSGD